MNNSISSYEPISNVWKMQPTELVHTPDAHRRLAKDEGFAKAVLDIWASERENDDNWVLCNISSIVYNNIDSEDHGELYTDDSSFRFVTERPKEVPLFGYIVRPSHILENDNSKQLPGVVLFHTGAGPSDVTMMWKADSLIHALGGECVVLIADLVSDRSGKAWEPSEWYAPRREVLMSVGANDRGELCRHVLQHRIHSAVEVLQSLSFVDSGRIGAMGWCLGGRAISELARMSLPGVACGISYHGVVDGGGVEDDKNSDDPTVEACRDNGSAGDNRHQQQISSGMKVLLCNGADDPFVSDSDLEACTKSFAKNGVDWRLISYENARHGFTNPAQDLNPSEAFGFHEKAAMESWNEGIELLKETLV